MQEAATFKALGDPVRLEMVKRLSGVQDMVISDLIKGFSLSRQGARKHLQVLADVGIVTTRTQGRETHVILDTRSLASAKVFIADLERQWASRLSALKAAVEQNEIERAQPRHSNSN